MKSGSLSENFKEIDIIVSLTMKEVHLICDMLEFAAESNKKKKTWAAMSKRFNKVPD